MVLQPPNVTDTDVHALIGRLMIENMNLAKKLEWFMEQTHFSENEAPLTEEAPSDLSKDKQES